jgi:Leucine-rich repeat (LRR) protein
VKLFCPNNRLVDLKNLPSGLKALHCYDNQLITLENLPRGLEKLHCFRNRLTYLKNLSRGVKVLDCFGNPLLFVEPVPKRPTRCCVPNDILDLFNSQDSYSKYYKNYVIFATNFYSLKTLLLFELGYLTLEILNDIKLRCYFSLKCEN